MLDVHPPHESAHSWKDFLIHIATICVGLLIAIGLEQTVEFFHHRHQYHRLQEDMLAEAQRNSTIIEDSLAHSRVFDDWTAKIVTEGRTAPLRNGYVDFDIPPMPPDPKKDAAPFTTVPSRAVWPIATANGLASLVPTEQAQIYNRVDFEATEALHISGLRDLESAHAAGVLARLGVQFTPGEHIHLTPTQLEDFLKAITEAQELNLWTQVRLAFWKGASDALLHHVSNMDDMFPYMNKEAAAVPTL